jgi:hypothetical protein
MKLAPDHAMQAILLGRAEEGLDVDGSLDLRGVIRPFRLPKALRVRGHLVLTGSAVAELPDGITAEGGIAATRCSYLARAGEDITASSLELTHCTRLERLSGPLSFTRVVLDGCTSLRELPDVVKGVELSSLLPAQFAQAAAREGAER